MPSLASDSRDVLDRLEGLSFLHVPFYPKISQFIVNSTSCKCCSCLKYSLTSELLKYFSEERLSGQDSRLASFTKEEGLPIGLPHHKPSIVEGGRVLLQPSGDLSLPAWWEQVFVVLEASHGKRFNRSDVVVADQSVDLRLLIGLTRTFPCDRGVSGEGDDQRPRTQSEIHGYYIRTVSKRTIRCHKRTGKSERLDTESPSTINQIMADVSQVEAVKEVEKIKTPIAKLVDYDLAVSKVRLSEHGANEGNQTKEASLDTSGNSRIGSTRAGGSVRSSRVEVTGVCDCDGAPVRSMS